MHSTSYMRLHQPYTPYPPIRCRSPVAGSRSDESMGVMLDRCLTLNKQVSAVTRLCNYHARAIRHIHHLSSTDLAQTLPCSLIISRINYYNALLHGAPASGNWNMFRGLPPGLFCRRQGGPTADYIQVSRSDVQDPPHVESSTPAYLSRLITARVCASTLHSSTVLLQSVPFHRTDFSGRAIRCSAPSAPTTWNSLPNIVISADSLASFKSRLKVYSETFRPTRSETCPPCPSTSGGAIYRQGSA